MTSLAGIESPAMYCSSVNPCFDPNLQLTVLDRDRDLNPKTLISKSLRTINELVRNPLVSTWPCWHLSPAREVSHADLSLRCNERLREPVRGSHFNETLEFLIDDASFLDTSCLKMPFELFVMQLRHVIAIISVDGSGIDG